MSNLDTQEQDRVLASAIHRLEVMRKQEAFDPFNLQSRPTDMQLRVLREFGTVPQQYVRAGNQSGKSQTCARIVSWVIEENHPYWKRPEKWGEEPLLVIIAGRTSKQLEESILPKLEAYLKPDSYKLVRIGNVIQRLEHENGNRIVFQSLENATVAQQRLQSYTAHLAWLDEMPPTLGILRELLIRVQARDGYFLASFTPTMVNADIQKFIDSIKEPDGKLYRFNMLDNPLYKDEGRKQQLLARYSNLPEHVQKSIFEGEWMIGDNLVYYFSWDTMVRTLPSNYSPAIWRHLVSVDPATQSKLGLTIWAENPENGDWYCILSDYIQGVYVPTDIVSAVEKKLTGYNVFRRVSDSEASWFINQARSMGYTYIPTYKKANRKLELIKQYQQQLGNKLFLLPSCTTLIDEMQECRWSDSTEGKIINGSKYHAIDTAHYAADNLPKWEGKQLPTSHHEWLWQQNTKRLENIEAGKRKLERKLERTRMTIQRRRRG